jgi:YegS/Rv2252/BmrU family lipid kinase
MSEKTGSKVKEEYIFIVNPTAGAAEPDKIIEKIHAVCRDRGIYYRILKTESPKKATEVVRRLPKSGKVVFGVGGDGTVNSVLNGIVGTKNVLGIIPNGTGNDFARGVLKNIDDVRPKIDLGRVNGSHYFLNAAGVGIDTDVTVNMNKFRKKFIPVSQRFPLAVAYTALVFRAMKLEFKIDGKPADGEMMIVVAANGRTIGGKYLIAPTSDPTDGKVDIIFADKIPKLGLPAVLKALETGDHLKDPRVHLRQAKKLEIKSAKEITMQLDGEFLPAKKFRLEVLPKAITVFNDKKFIAEVLK